MGTRQCPICGAYLDPDERCDCRDEAIATSQQEKSPADYQSEQD